MPYDFDPTGSLPANLVVDELHTITEINANTYNIIIPEFAPFYTNNLSVVYNDGINGDVTLQENVHYVLCLPYIAASRSIGAMVYGGITFLNDLPSGTIKFTYQTIGGDWIADPNYVYSVLVNIAYNPRITSWDLVTNIQQIFPPVNHDQSLDYVFGYEDLIAKIDDIVAAIASRPPSVFNLGVNLEPSKLLGTDPAGVVTTIEVPVADILVMVNGYAALLNRLDNIEARLTALE